MGRFSGWARRGPAQSSARSRTIMVGTAACVCSVLFIVTAEAVLSGLYIDNGIDQTVIQHSMTRDERLVVEHEILELLGLGERPRRARAATERAAPAFLLDVYKRLEQEHEQARPTRSSEEALSGDEQQAIDQSDLIMTFQSKSEHQSIDSFRNEHSLINGTVYWPVRRQTPTILRYLLKK